MAALLITITVINIAIATGTELGGLARWSLSLVGGLLAAATVQVIVTRRRGPSHPA